MPSRRIFLVLLCAVLICCVFCGAWLAFYLWHLSRNRAVEFLFLGEDGRLCQQKRIEVEGCTVCVGLVGKAVPRVFSSPLKAVRPYIDVELSNPSPVPTDFQVDPDEVVVKDSEGHRFKVVGAWPVRLPWGRRFRLDLDAIEFNKHVKYQRHMRWYGWGPDERYTLSLHFPFTYKGVKHTIDVPRIACLRRPGYRFSAGEVFGPTSPLQWDERPERGTVFRGTPLDTSAPIPLLVDALKEEDWVVRMAAARALQRIGPQAKSALPALIEALHDGNDAVRGTAAGAIQSIEGRDWREVEREWKERERN